jgi:thiamine biosynthesis lipoprotein
MQYREKLFDDSKKLLYAWFSAMFTRIDIMLLTDNSGHDLKKLAEKIQTEIERVEMITSRFDKNSEISWINNSAYGNSCKISPELFHIIDECLMYNSKTLGYFDITVNSINGFTKGITNIQLNQRDKTLRFLHPDLKLDLSGFIKGYVLRAIRNLIQADNINNALINIGNSSILALGNHPNGSGWKISLPEEQLSNEWFFKMNA